MKVHPSLPPESPTALEPPPKPKFKIPDPHNGFSQDELTYIQKSGFPTPNEAYNQLLDETFDLDGLEIAVNDKISRGNHVKAGLSKNKIKNKDEIEDLTRQIDTLKKYIDRIKNNNKKAATKAFEKGAEQIGEKTGQLIGEKIYNKFTKTDKPQVNLQSHKEDKGEQLMKELQKDKKSKSKWSTLSPPTNKSKKEDLFDDFDKLFL